MIDRQNVADSSIISLDDDLALHAVYDLLASGLGVSHSNFDTIENALEHFEDLDEAPQILILDRWLPDGDGLDFAVHLRDKIPQFSDTAFLLISGANTDKDDPRLVTGRIEHIFEKPFKLNELSNCVSQLLSKATIETSIIKDDCIIAAFADDLSRLSIELLHASQSTDGNSNRILHSIYGIAGMLEQETLRMRTAHLMSLDDDITKAEYLPRILEVVQQCESLAQQLTERSGKAVKVIL